MSSNFKKEYIETRDDAFKDIKSSSNEWNKFIKFWSRLIDKHSIDNILNIYSYNPYGKVFMTFDEWNSDDIDLTPEEIMNITLTREFIDKFLKDETTKYLDPTNYPELHG